MALRTYRQIFMPYLLEKVPEGHKNVGKYVFLNREYIPLSFTDTDLFKKISPKENLRYDFAVEIRITKSLYEKIRSGNSHETIDKFWLYNDSTTPDSSAKFMRQYMKKIELLMKKECVESEYKKFCRKNRC